MGLDQYFTPTHVAQAMVDLIPMNDIKTVLEPSAGSGELAKAFRDDFDIAADVCEIDIHLHPHLSKEGFNIVGDNFLAYKPDFVYDLVIMNPPHKVLFPINGHRPESCWAGTNVKRILVLSGWYSCHQSNSMTSFSVSAVM